MFWETGMPVNGFGTALKVLRTRRSLSQRELGVISNLDNAYINRLESGDKTNPSAEALGKLLGALEASTRDVSMLTWLAEHADAEPDLVSYVLDHPDIALDYFVSAATMRFRGDARPTPEKLIERVKRLYEDEG
jgi:transcriptional regulator with XRE-family HTH domain